VLFFIACILTLTPLAYASPPDPTWQLGFFDDDDFDEVVGYTPRPPDWPRRPLFDVSDPFPFSSS
jgi:hypothetical protein